MHDVFSRAAANPQRILLNEPGDPRVLAAASALAERGLCIPVLLGDRAGIERFSAKLAREMAQREKLEREESGGNGNGGSGGNGGNRGRGRKKKQEVDDDKIDLDLLPADVRFLRGLSRCEIIDPYRPEEVGEMSREYAHALAEARKHKGMTLAAARELLLPDKRKQPRRRSSSVVIHNDDDASLLLQPPGGASIYFSTMMLRCGDADGLLSGASHTTLETVKPALQLLRKDGGGGGGGRGAEEEEEEERERGATTRTAAAATATATTKIAPPGLVSSLFFMCLPRGVVAYADCALNVSPDPPQLARIALDSAATAAAFGLSPPRVALLSYSTRGSGRGLGPDAVAEAAELAQRNAPGGVFVDGPLQYDAAVSPSVAALKLASSTNGGDDSSSSSSSSSLFDVAGRANVLVFPSLDAGNIAYKAVQQSTSAAAVGPVLQGLERPVNDLSRGASVDDVVCTAAVTAVQAIAAAEERRARRSG